MRRARRRNDEGTADKRECTQMETGRRVAERHINDNRGAGPPAG